MDVIDDVIGELFPERQIGCHQRSLMKWAFGMKQWSLVIQNTSPNVGVLWVESVVELLQMRFETRAVDLVNIPEEGPAIVFSNHPTVIDGLALLYLVSRVRKDIKIIANHVLPMIFPQVKDITVGIKNMSGKISHKKFKEMNDHLKNGGLLIVCPAGKLASLGLSGLKESAWHPGFIQLALRNNAILVPVKITGANSKRYYLIARLWRQLSNLMVIRESLRHKNKTLRIDVGRQLNPDNFNNKDLYISALECRRHVLNLSNDNEFSKLSVISPIASSESKKNLLQAIKKCQKLKEVSKGKQVLLYRRQDLTYSPILNELGRLREIAFRKSGVGSGMVRDNDIYDNSYYHIILWDPDELEIVGAYRVMPVAEQINKLGKEGLYSNSLFSFKETAFPLLKQCLEIGRGFIQEKYQKTNALDSLWQGIFSFIKQHPDIKYFMGVLTIPKGYPVPVKEAILLFFQIYFYSQRDILSSVDLWALKNNVGGLFCGTDFNGDLEVLKTILQEHNCDFPWPLKQAIKWYTPGGSEIVAFIDDKKFHSLAGLNICNISMLNGKYARRYLNEL